MHTQWTGKISWTSGFKEEGRLLILQRIQRWCLCRGRHQPSSLQNHEPGPFTKREDSSDNGRTSACGIAEAAAGRDRAAGTFGVGENNGH